jgi:hypothetical protein
MAEVVVSVGAAGKTCPYCRFPLKSGILAESCDACETVHHQECWQEGAGCAVFGCANNPGVAQNAARQEVPAASYATASRAASPAGKQSLYGDGWAFPISYRSGVVVNGLPLELWAVIGLLAVAGVYLVQLALRALPDSFRLLGYSWYPHTLAFVLLILILLVGALGAALLWLGWRLHQRSRVARGLTYVAVASLTTTVLFGDGVTTGEVLAMLAGLAAAGILGLSPAVRPLFTGADAPDGEQPSALVVARVSIALWLILLGVAAVLDFCLANLDGKYAAIGVFEAAVVAGGIAIYRRLGLADRRARLIATGGAGLAFILLLIGRHDVGFALLLGLTAAIPVCLWLPTEVRAFYGDSPIVLAREPAP